MQNRRRDFDLFSSQLVIQESSAGDAAVAQTRLQLLSDISLVQVNVDCVSLARALVERGPIPEKAAIDALHIAIAIVHGCFAQKAKIECCETTQPISFSPP